MCYCGNTGAERIPKWGITEIRHWRFWINSWLDSGEENSPAAKAGPWTCDLSTTSPGQASAHFLIFILPPLKICCFLKREVKARVYHPPPPPPPPPHTHTFLLKYPWLTHIKLNATPRSKYPWPKNANSKCIPCRPPAPAKQQALK